MNVIRCSMVVSSSWQHVVWITQFNAKPPKVVPVTNIDFRNNWWGCGTKKKIAWGWDGARDITKRRRSLHDRWVAKVVYNNNHYIIWWSAVVTTRLFHLQQEIFQTTCCLLSKCVAVPSFTQAQGSKQHYVQKRNAIVVKITETVVTRSRTKMQCSNL